MSYLVLARKWRPQRFSEVIGQETVTLTLQNAFKSGRVHHAYLLTGSRGVGKTTIARILAKCLVCESGESTEPCNICSQCVAVTEGRSLDVMEIDGASNTSVDDVRALREGARYQPTSARLKVFIIDEVHMLSTSAFNALLKILEEPPPHVKFIFATTEPHKIPVTILSRCQRFDFGRVPAATIVSYLQKMLATEQLSVPEESLYVIAKAAQGGIRDSLSLLDQVMSFSAGAVTHEEVIRILGFTPRKLVLGIVDAILTADTQKALLFLTEAFNAGHDLSLLMEEIATEFRHLLIAAAIGSATTDIADLSADELSAIQEKAAQYGMPDLQRLFAMGLEGIASVAKSHNPILHAELVIVKLANRPALHEMQEIGDAIARLERLAGSSPPPSLDPVNVAVGPAPVKQATPPNSEPAKTLKDIDANWLAFVKEVSTKNIFLGSHLEHGNFVAFEPTDTTAEVLVEFHHRVHHQGVSENTALMLPFLRQYFGPQATLKITLKAYGDNHVAPNISDAREEEKRRDMVELRKRAYADPVVQKAVEMFGGEIISVAAPSQK